MRKYFFFIIIIIIAGILLFLNFSEEKIEIAQVSDSLLSVIGVDSTNDGLTIDKLVEENVDDLPGVKEKDDETVVNDRVSDQETLVGISAKVNISAPFIVQAPFGDWNEDYKEACEEASVLIVAKFYENQNKLSEQEMKDELDEIIPWGEDYFNSVDTNAEKTALYFTEYFGIDESRVHVVYDMTIDDIKAVLSEGYPVVVPAAGRELGNKYFRTPGPLYHMLVITGYTRDEFITNDPGTKRGEGYRYDQEVLYNAIHDLTGDKEKITEGRKAMIIVKPD